MKYLSDNKEIIDDATILSFLKKVGNQKPLLKELIMANLSNTNNEMSATVAHIIATEFDKDEDIKQQLKLDTWEWYKDSINLISLNCTLSSNRDKLKDIYEEYEDCQYELNSCYASYNFIISMANENMVFDHLKYYLTESQDTFEYRMILGPLTTRLRRDKAMAYKLYEELLNTEDPRLKVGIYSILSSAGVMSFELREWRKHQHIHLDEYGHDIVRNRDRQLIAVMQ